MFSVNKKNRGYTLTEILLVITIIALLAVAGFILYQTQLNKANDALRKKDLNDLRIAFENYYSDHGCYPPASTLNFCGGAQLKPYLAKIPCDPVTHAPYILKLDGPYCAQAFTVYSVLQNSSDPQILCNSRYVVHSSNLYPDQLDAACHGDNFCANGFYGCVQGECRLISSVTQPHCGNLQCVSDCSGHCGDPNWEVFPQPCLP